MNLMAASTFIVSVLAAIGAQPAQATILQNGTGLSNPAATLGFDDVALSGTSVAYTPLTTQYTSSNGVTFGGFYGSGDYAFTGAPAPDIVNFSGDNQPQNLTVTLTFATVETNVAFFLVTSGQATETITSSLGGNAVESVTGYSASFGNYVGFTNSAFDTITISRESGNTPRDGSIVLDNLQIGSLETTIPEPSSTGIMVLGLAGLMVLHDRNRRA